MPPSVSSEHAQVSLPVQPEEAQAMGWTWREGRLLFSSQLGLNQPKPALTSSPS